MNFCGIIERLWRYPVKSLLGESCPELSLDRRGVIGDRWFAIQNSKGKFGSGKNTRRFCKIEGLFDFQAIYDDNIVLITFPNGRVFRSDDPDLDQELSSILEEPVSLVSEKKISHFDADSLHLVNTASLQWLRNMLPKSRIDERRFRPNFLINTSGKRLIEHDWIGKKFLIGQEVKIEITSLTERCIVTTFSQTDLDEDAKILKTISKNFRHNFGVYAKVMQPGVVRLGDKISYL